MLLGKCCSQLAMLLPLVVLSSVLSCLPELQLLAALAASLQAIAGPCCSAHPTPATANAAQCTEEGQHIHMKAEMCKQSTCKVASTTMQLYSDVVQ